MATKKTTKAVKKPAKKVMSKKTVKKAVKKVIKKPAAKKKTAAKKSKKPASKSMMASCGLNNCGPSYSSMGDCSTDMKSCGRGACSSTSKVKDFLKKFFS